MTTGITITDLIVPGFGRERSWWSRAWERLRSRVRRLRGVSDAVHRGGSATVPVRCYEPAGEDPIATLVWAHGGSFVRGTLDWPEADWVSRQCAERGLRVVSVDYALASDRVKAPGPALDVAAALVFARSTYPGAVVLGGASAGAHLATKAALMRSGIAAHLVLLYPTLHRVQRHDAAIDALTQKLPPTKQFDPDRIRGMYDTYLGEGARPAGDTTVVGELSRQALAVLPPTTIIAAEYDDLRVSAEMFAEQLREADVRVTLSVMPGTVHGYANRPDASPRALRDAHETIDALVAAIGV